ncbi:MULTISPECIES: hypothetical protein [Klebsiella pneumoniae complex]|uniref:hypothetical protein n=1 Tax=Klebsiella pneumoniae complex TaxID=3390273 RepID=UPI000E2AAC61|nr:hypothetical protein [Klebsiella variicola]HCA9839105.1 hypothetical protein [Klebsiella variicola subsp. variicola]EKU8624217.1 hypothetical protein [Klebsiella variicola]SXD58364.1 Uncharacterised protein [Klebsiella variicola]GKL10541.1 hypothetical protein NUKP49_17210 [Klebsiella variicola]HBQ5665674.1 hypothetical protein [Klebsiella variicola]
MSFSELEAAAKKFTTLINQDLEMEFIQPVTLVTPSSPLDQFHFMQLVVWCYGFFFEAANEALKECKALMKQGNPQHTNEFEQGHRLVNQLRTYKVHNLPPSKTNNYTRKCVETWLAQFNEDTSRHQRACESLYNTALSMINYATEAWIGATKDPEDAKQLFKRVMDASENNWAHHELSQIAHEIAEEINLSGFDAKEFCNNYLEEWRKTAGCFFNRESAEAGIRRTIRLTIYNLFGQSAYGVISTKH